MNASVMERLKVQARARPRRIVLAESVDPRVVAAAVRLDAGGLASVILLHCPELKNPGGSIEVVDPQNSERHAEVVGHLLAMRQAKGLTSDQASSLARDPLYFAGLLVATGQAEGAVAGSLATTADVIRAGLHTIGTPPGRKLVSSCFLMELAGGRVVTFADCAVVPRPDAGQLAEIAVTSAATHFRLTGQRPCVAMLSFSTRGSAAHEDAEKVVSATRIARGLDPDLAIDGELQFDAAFDPEVAARKASDSAVAGKANVFVFPDLDAGNIGYKIAQRIGGAGAIGPIVQGLRAPFMDLSRGCSIDDIVNVAVVAALIA